MIAFDLTCSAGHQFEGWFASSLDFGTQQASGLLVCPMCDDADVRKALSVPNVGRKGNQMAAAGRATSTPDDSTPSPAVDSSVIAPAVAKLIEKLAVAQGEMLKTSQWVGGNFAETARAIHYGEEADRFIHGETSTQEAKALVEEGINVAPLPFPVVPPSAKN